MSWFTDWLSGAGDAAKIAAALGIGTAGGLSIKDAYDRLGDVGTDIKDYSDALATAGLTQTAFKPFSLTSTTGSSFGVDASGNITMGLSPQEQAIQSMMMNQAQTALGQNPAGYSQGLLASQGAYDLGQDFMTRAGVDTGQRESDVYERMRALQRPGEERERLGLEERLANQGRLGVTTNLFGGTPEQLALSKAQAEAKNQAALSAMQQAQAEQLQQANIGSTYAGLGSQLASQNLGMLGAQQQLGLGALAGSYVPQAQLSAMQQASQIYPQLFQKGQLSGASLFGEATMSGIEGLLGAELGRANLMQALGTGLLGGLFK